MSRKPRTTGCLFHKCTNHAILGLKVCPEHQHPLKLQQEILREMEKVG